MYEILMEIYETMEIPILQHYETEEIPFFQHNDQPVRLIKMQLNKSVQFYKLDKKINCKAALCKSESFLND